MILMDLILSQTVFLIDCLLLDNGFDGGGEKFAGYFV
jgi:hypothetical protein